MTIIVNLKRKGWSNDFYLHLFIDRCVVNGEEVWQSRIDRQADRQTGGRTANQPAKPGRDSELQRSLTSIDLVMMHSLILRMELIANFIITGVYIRAEAAACLFIIKCSITYIYGPFVVVVVCYNAVVWLAAGNRWPVVTQLDKSGCQQQQQGSSEEQVKWPIKRSIDQGWRWIDG